MTLYEDWTLVYRLQRSQTKCVPQCMDTIYHFRYVLLIVEVGSLENKALEILH